MVPLVSRHLSEPRKKLVEFNRLPASPWPQCAPLQSAPAVCHDSISRIPQKFTVANCDMRTYAESDSGGRYPGHMRAYTDGSVSTSARPATAAVTSPSLWLDWCCRLSSFAWTLAHWPLDHLTLTTTAALCRMRL